MQLEAQATEGAQAAVSAAGEDSTSTHVTVAAPMEVDIQGQEVKAESRGTKRTAEGEPVVAENNKKMKTGEYITTLAYPIA